MNEIWKDIKGYEGLYQVSNLGRVKSLDKVMICKDGKVHHWKEKVLKPSESKKQYLKVKLQNNGVKQEYSIHRLVAEAFLPNPDNFPQVDHIDGDKHNNIVLNLRFVTNKMNANNPNTKYRISHPCPNDLKIKKSLLMKGKAPSKQCIEAAQQKHYKKVGAYNKGCLVKTYNSLTEASSDMGCTISAISKSIKRNGTCNGFKLVLF